jgi:3-dehydroquinate dehydratase type I
LVNPKICVSIIAGSTSQAVETIRSIKAQKPDLLELRFDYIKSIQPLKKIRDATDLPLIATNRRIDQGGLSSIPEKDRVATLIDACDAGFEYVDLELTTSFIGDATDKVKERGTSLILSYHDFNCTPDMEGLDRIMSEELRLGADICKIVGTSRTYSDSLTYLRFLEENKDVDLVCFGMGKYGIISRVFSPIFGGKFTYASAKVGLESAEGQLAIADLRALYRKLRV